MRVVTILSLLIFSVSCITTKNPILKTGKLDGTWIPIRQEMGGTPLPESTLANQQLILKDTTYTFIAESVDKGIVKYGDEKMDIYGKEGVNAGNHITAIYKLENNQLTICYNLLGIGYPETYETKGNPMYFLSVFKKSGE